VTPPDRQRSLAGRLRRTEAAGKPLVPKQNVVHDPFVEI
jgi:hypothetical protein